MSITAAELKIKIGADTKDAEAGFKRTQSNISELSKGATTASKGVEGVGLSIGGMVGKLGAFGLAANGVQAISASLGGLTTALIGGNAGMEQAMVGFTTMLHSADAAKEHVAALQKFAIETPFEFRGLVSSSQKLQAMGFTAQEVIPTLTGIGNAVAGLGGGQFELDRITLALGQVKAKGKLAGDEVLQLAEIGIPVWDIMAKAMGKSTAEVQKLSEKGLIPADFAIKTLVNGMNERFPDMMKAQAKTFNGMISNLHDWIDQTKDKITKPIFEPIKASLQGVLDFLGSPAMAKGVDVLTQVVQGAVNTSVGIFKGFVSFLGPIFGGIGSAISTAMPFIKAFIAGVQGMVVPDSAKSLTAFFVRLGNEVHNGIQVAKDAVATFKGALAGNWTDSPALNNTVRFFGLLGTIVHNGVQLATDAIKTFKGALSGDWTGQGAEKINPLVLAIGRFGQFIRNDAIPAIQNFVNSPFVAHLAAIWQALSPVNNAVAIFSGLLKGGLPGAAEAARQQIKQLGDVLGIDLLGSLDKIGGFINTTVVPIVSKLAQVFNDDVKPAVEGFFKFIEPALPTLGTAAGLFLGLMQTVGFLSGAFEAAGAIVMPILGAIGAAIAAVGAPVVLVVGAIALLAAAFITNFGGIRTASEPVLKAVGEALAELGKWLGENVPKAIDQLVTFVQGTLVPALTNIWNFIVEIGTRIFGFIQGNWDTIKGYFEGVWNVIQGIFEIAWSVISNGLKIFTSIFAGDWGQAWEGVKNLVAGIWDGIGKIIDGAWKIITNFIRLGLAAVWDVITGIWSAIYNFIAGILTGIWNFIVGIWNGIANFIGGIMTGIWNTISNAWNTIAAIVGQYLSLIWNIIVNIWNEIWNTISGILTGIWNFISGTFGGIFSTIAGILGQIFDIWASIWGGIFDLIFSVLGQIAGAIGSALGFIWDTISSIFGQVWDFISSIWNQIADFIGTVLGNIWGLISSIWSQIADFIGSILGSIWDGISSVWDGISSTIGNVLGNIWGTISSIWGQILDFIGSVLGNIWNSVTESWNNIFTTIGDVLSNIWGTIQSVWNQVWDFISKVIGNIWNSLVDGWNNILNSIKNALSNIKQNITDGFNAVKDAITGFIGTALETAAGIGKAIIDGIVNGIKSAPGVIWDALKGILGGAWDLVKGFLGIHSPSKKAQDEIGAPISQGVAKGIANQAKVVAEAMADLGSQIKKVGLDEVAKQTETLSKIADGASKMAGALASLKTSEGVSSDVIQHFIAGMTELVTAFMDASRKFDAKGAEAAAKYADTAGKVADLVGKMTQAFEKLQTFSGLNKGSIEAFNAATYELTNAFVAASGKFTSDMLAAVTEYSDTVLKIADAVLAMTSVFDRLQGYSKLDVGHIEQFNANVVELVNAFSAGAGLFTSDMLAAAQDYSSTAAKIADDALKVIKLLEAIRDYSKVDVSRIEEFNANVVELVNAFQSGAALFNAGMLAGAEKFSETAAKVADGGLKVLDLLNQLREYQKVSLGNIQMFNGDIIELMNAFVAASQLFNVGMLDGAARYAETVGKVTGSVMNAAAALNALRTYKAIMGDHIRAFFVDLNNVVDSFVESASWFDTKSLEAATKYAESAGKMVGVIEKAVKALDTLSEYRAIAQEKIHSFFVDLNDVIDSFIQSAAQFEVKALAAGERYAESAGKMTDGIGKAISALKQLQDWQDIPQEAISSFVGALDLTMNLISDAAAHFESDGLAKVGQFGDATGKLFNGLKSAIEIFTKLKDYKSVPSAVISEFLADVNLTVSLASDMAQRIESDLMAQISKFGESVGKLFNGLKSAMEVFKNLEKFKSTPSEVIKQFIDEVVYTVNLAGQMAQKADIELMGQALKFLEAANKIFNALKGAMEAIKAVEEYKDIPVNLANTLIAKIVTAITQMVEAVNKSKEFKELAEHYRDNMTDAARAIIDGANAANKAAQKAAEQVGGPANPGPSNNNPAPSFDSGGIVPGPYGQPMLAVVHGGERFLGLRGQRNDLTNHTGGQDAGAVYITVGDINVAIPPGTNVNNPQELARIVRQEVAKALVEKGRADLANQQLGFSSKNRF